MIRNPTSNEIKGDPTKETSGSFEPILLPEGKPKSPSDLFVYRLGKEGEKASKKELPFAEASVRAEYQDKLDRWNKEFRRQGYATAKKPTFEEIDWNKYSDLKNFELVDEGQTRDPGMSKEHKVAVYVKWKKYTFKGFSNTYTVMEDGEKALTRALDSLLERQPRKEK